MKETFQQNKFNQELAEFGAPFFGYGILKGLNTEAQGMYINNLTKYNNAHNSRQLQSALRGMQNANYLGRGTSFLVKPVMLGINPAIDTYQLLNSKSNGEFIINGLELGTGIAASFFGWPAALGTAVITGITKGLNLDKKASNFIDESLKHKSSFLEELRKYLKLNDSQKSAIKISDNIKKQIEKQHPEINNINYKLPK